MSRKVQTTAKITRVDQGRAATDIDYARNLTAEVGFYAYDPCFEADVLGDDPHLQLLITRDYQFAHEAGVYIKSTDRVYFTANFQTCDPIELYSVHADADLSGADKDAPRTTVDVRKEEYSNVVQANGACNYNDGILYCAQGSTSRLSALTLVDLSDDPPTSHHLLNNFHGRPFNSVNDVVVHHRTGDIWFTDPTYGYQQAFRPPPELPNQVYRFTPSTGECSVVAEGFDMCNGLCFSPDYKTMYITDTGAVKAHQGPKDGHAMSFNLAGAATIYAYDVVNDGKALMGRRTFAFTDNGVPDGIKCDEKGYVYSGCGDGVHVWSKEGMLVGKIVVGGIVANFCFAKTRMWLFAETKLWVCELKARGALVSLECAQE